LAVLAEVNRLPDASEDFHDAAAIFQAIIDRITELEAKLADELHDLSESESRLAYALTEALRKAEEAIDSDPTVIAAKLALEN
jgi:hypothetical protein